MIDYKKKYWATLTETEENIRDAWKELERLLALANPRHYASLFPRTEEDLRDKLVELSDELKSIAERCLLIFDNDDWPKSWLDKLDDKDWWAKELELRKDWRDD